VGSMSCNLLDETLIVFAALQLRERRQLDASTTDLMLLGLALGTACGIALTDRLLARVSPLRLLGYSCVTCLVSYLAWLQLSAAWASALALFIAGVAIGPQFPLAQAQCYRRSRDEPVLVNVIESWLEPIHVLLPWLLGLVAERFGLTWALVLLLLQPLSLLLCIWLASEPTRCEPHPR
jgi:predicted MFS family arabinose efflux permease